MPQSGNIIYTPEEIRGMILGLDTKVRLDNGEMVPAINLDNAATTPPFKQVAEEIHSRLMYYGSIGRGMGQKSEVSSEVYEAGRETVKEFVGLRKNDDRYVVFYTNNTTDGINKLASALIESPDDVVLTTRMEHHANDIPWRMRLKQSMLTCAGTVGWIFQVSKEFSRPSIASAAR